MPRDEATLPDIARSARLILQFREGLDTQASLQDVKAQWAVLHRLLVMGESVKRLSVAFRDAHPDIPWRLMAGMRDRLIHAYDTVDLEEIWRVADRDVPELLTALEPLLPPQEPQ